MEGAVEEGFRGFDQSLVRVEKRLGALVNRLPVKNSGRDRSRVRCEVTPIA